MEGNSSIEDGEMVEDSNSIEDPIEDTNGGEELFEDVDGGEQTEDIAKYYRDLVEATINVRFGEPALRTAKEEANEKYKQAREGIRGLIGDAECVCVEDKSGRPFYVRMKTTKGTRTLKQNDVLDAIQGLSADGVEDAEKMVQLVADTLKTASATERTSMRIQEAPELEESRRIQTSRPAASRRTASAMIERYNEALAHQKEAQRALRERLETSRETIKTVEPIVCQLMDEGDYTDQPVKHSTGDWVLKRKMRQKKTASKMTFPDAARQAWDDTAMSLESWGDETRRMNFATALYARVVVTTTVAGVGLHGHRGGQ